VILPHTPEQAERWRARGPEPIQLAPEGWTRTEVTSAFPNERCYELRRGSASVTVTRWWDRPLHPGGPMVTESTRAIEIDGHSLDLATTSQFDGRPRQVGVVFVRGEDWLVRIVFDSCSDATCDEICAAVRIIGELPT